jgi:hypothetical protein
MLRTSLNTGVVVWWGVVLANSSPALAASVTSADLSGRKICWSNGGTPTYGKNGVYDEKTLGHGTWRLAGGRLTVVASNGKYSGAIARDSVTFHLSGRIKFSGPSVDLEVSGKYCD